jgi:hypothetical protein
MIVYNANMKRLAVLLLSIGTLVLYGHAIAGLGGGDGRPFMIAYGLVGGTATAIVALFVWKLYLRELESSHLKGEEEKNDAR